jgi:hypothetical protein
VIVRESKGIERSTRTATDGSFGVAEIARGAARVSVEAVGHIADQTNVILTPGEETRVTFRLAPQWRESAESVIEVTVRGERLAPGVSSYTRQPSGTRFEPSKPCPA